MAVLQATCVEIGGRAVLIEGPPGSGKSSLALGLIDRGARLVGDDGVTINAQGERLIASPPPNTRGLIEIRNLGLVPQPVCESAPVCLSVMLDPDAPRFIDQPERVTIEGISLPHVRLWPGATDQVLKAEYALALFGLSSG